MNMEQSKTHEDRTSVSSLTTQMFTMLTEVYNRFNDVTCHRYHGNADISLKITDTTGDPKVIKGIRVFSLPRKCEYDECVYLPTQTLSYARFIEMVQTATRHLNKDGIDSVYLYVHLVADDGLEYEIISIGFTERQKQSLLSGINVAFANLTIEFNVQQVTKFADLPIENK